ncbi:MAG: sensor domain-containing diguanylate cyclase [Campylobacterales bacterium]|nr:sensor domain-containing diguanylate cyclase [Campylobacterales bacterium]
MEKNFFETEIFSINTTLTIGIFFSLLLPIIFALWYTSTDVQERLYADFKEFRQKTARNIADALSKSVYFFHPNSGGLVLEVLKHDPRVVKIVVYDTYNDMEFLEIHVPNRERGELFLNTEMIYMHSKPIGYVAITYNDSMLTRHIKEQKNFFLRIFAATFLLLLAVLIPLLYVKVLWPLEKLTHQALKLQSGKLDEAFEWKGKDEISLLGQSFELARLQIRQHVHALKNASETDKLTKVFNRHKTDVVLEEEKERLERYGRSFGVLLIDIDNFKITNDTFGHQTGDRVLVEIAMLLKRNSRHSDTVGRWGGEEFIVICPEVDGRKLEEFAWKVVQLVAKAPLGGTPPQTVSVGGALCRKGEGVSKMMLRADKALYEAKTRGKNKAIIVT